MKKRVADIVVETLLEYGVTTCFSVVGGGSMHLNNAFAICESIEKIYNHHEQACAMAAEAYARACGRMAAVCVTSGPGGTNAINGVQGAWVDSVPMIVISGHPRQNTTVAATGLQLRCRGVQENDIITQVKSITKYAKCIINYREIKRELIKAIAIALEGRRGPVWLDIPLDVQGNHVDIDELYDVEENGDSRIDIKGEIAKLHEKLSEAKRPCILTGSAIRTGDCIQEFREFVSQIRIPIVGGALQGDICYSEQENYYGTSGSTGPRCGNFILQNADFILVLGNSLSFKQTGFDQKKFALDAKIVMVDAQEDEAKKPDLHIDWYIVCELKEFFTNAKRQMMQLDAPREWNDYCRFLKKQFPEFEALHAYGEVEQSQSVSALYWWNKMLSLAKQDAVFCLGNSSCVVPPLVEGVKKPTQRLLVNYNCGSMGDDLPNAIGAAIAFKREIICVTGDGSIMMNLQELQTIRHYRLPIKVVIFCNDGYGAIRNTCRNYFDGVYMGCDKDTGVSFPSFEKIANAFGFAYRKCSKAADTEDGIQWLNDQDTFCILEIVQRQQEIQGLRLESLLLEDGSFVTPALHQLSPRLDDEEKYMVQNYISGE